MVTLLCSSLRTTPLFRHNWARLGSSLRQQARYNSSQQDEFDEYSNPVTPAASYTLAQERRGNVITYHVSGSPSQGFTFSQHKHSKHDAAANSEDGKPTSSLYRHVASLLKATFLPAGYPGTAGSGYWDYVLWQSVMNVAVSANTVLASTFLLYAVGLGAGAIPTAGALNWVLKDGLGQLGTLIFGKTIAHNFDIHSKTWFFLSMLMLKAATGVEILTILMPQYFLLMGTIANSLKGLAFMANGSTRSVFNLSFARDNNIADITAKGTSQYICASMIGTVAGATLCSWVGQDPATALACYTALTAATLVSSYATVKTIPLSTLNNTRLQLMCESYLSTIASAAAARLLQRRARIPSAFGMEAPSASRGEPLDVAARSLSARGGKRGRAADSGGYNNGWMPGSDHDVVSDADLDTNADSAGLSPLPISHASPFEREYDEYLNIQVPSPAELAAEDPPLPFLMGDQRLLNPAIIVGDAMERVLDGTGPEMIVVLLSTYRLSHALVVPRGSAVHVILHQQATPRDICQAYLQACLLRQRMREGSPVGIAAALHAGEVLEAQQREAATAELLVRARQAAEDARTAQQSSSGSDSEEGASSQQSAGLSTAMTSSSSSSSSSWGSNSNAVNVFGPQCAVKGSSSAALAELRIALQDTLQTAERLTSPFMRSLEAAGWKLEKVVVEADKKRARW